MKYFIAIALIATVASAAVLKPTVVSGELAHIEEIIAAIQSPSTDPATAAALQEMLLESLGITPEGISVLPALVDGTEPISIGPAIVDFPVAEVVAPSPAPAVVAEAAPAVVADAAAASSPLVQIIVNVQSSGAVAGAPAVEAAPAAVPEAVVPEIAAHPVAVVDQAPIEASPVVVVDQAPIVAAPVVVVDEVPAAAEPVIVAEPILVAPAVVLPEILN